MISSISAAVRVTERAPVQPQSAPTGFESRRQMNEEGWLGQVPPATPQAHGACACCTKPAGPTYANPQIAPEPWLAPPSWSQEDPTLFG